MSKQGNRGNIAQLFGKPWIPAYTESLEPPEIQLRQAIQHTGLVPPEQVYLNGQIHRFSTDGSRKNKSGWYVAFADGVPAGVFGDWKDDGKHSWRADIGRELTALESLEVTERFREASEIRERQRMFKQKATAEECRTIWDSLEAAPEDHPYIYRKGVKAHGARITQDGRLVLPLFDEHGGLCSLQYIDVDGKKMFHPGGKARGCFWSIGEIEGSKKVFIAEGFATAATIHEKTGIPVIIAYNAKNLIPVAASIRVLLPTGSLVIVADHDASQTGQKCAAEAAKASGAEVIVPPEEGDANDFVQAGGDLKTLLLGPSADRWLVSADDFSMSPSPIKWLVRRWVQEDALIMVFGQSGSGKSFLVLDWCMHIASGKESWIGQKVHHGHVVYLAGEGHHGLRSRIAAWKQYHQVATLDMSLSLGATDLNTPEGLNRTISSIREIEKQPKLIVVDTLHRFLMGDENSAQDAKTMLDSCAMLMQEFSCSVLLVHHTGVSSDAQNRARGSSAWRGALDNEILVEPGGPGKPIRVVQRKVKDAEMVDPLHVELEQVNLPWMDEEGELVSSAIVVEAVAPAHKERDAKQRERIRDMVAAWSMSGEESVDGMPYLTKSAWKDYLKRENPDTKEAALRQRFKASDERSMISRMINEGVVQEYHAGYVVIDAEISSAMMLSTMTVLGR